MNRTRTLFASSHLGCLLLVGFTLSGCGGDKKGAESGADVATGARAEDMSRCEFRGRQDRDVQESGAPGTIVPNVRRVYGYIGSGEERRRVLMCREVDTNFDGTKDLVRTYGDQGEKLTEQADSDFDGKIDTWITFAGARPAKIELDKSGDGEPDETRFYVGGQLARVQRDSNKDGKADIFEVYRDGRLERMGIDANFDGQVDSWARDEIRAREEAEKESAEREPDDSADAASASSADGG